MLIEYDVVIIGATELGCHMALRARELGARVALVEQGERPDGTIAFRQWISRLFIAYPTISNGSELDTIALQDQLSPFTPEALQIQGIDYIVGCGSYVTESKIGFQIETSHSEPSSHRLLRSTHFISALTPKRRIPVALWKIPCWFPESLPKSLPEPLPQKVAIVGEAIVGVELAMALKTLGIEVTLMVPTPQILPQLPPEGAFRIQMILEAAGIEVLTETRLRSADNLHHKIQLDINSKSLEVDAVILATAFERLEAEALGLRSLNGIALRRHRLHLVGPASRRSGHHPMDGLISNAESMALAEVQHLLMPWRRVRSIPVGQLMHPSSFWIGSFAQSKRDRNLQTLTGSSPDQDLWYQLTLTPKGKLINATVVGENASQFGPLLSLMLQTKMPLHHLTTIALSHPMQSQVIHQWVVQWELWMRSRHRLRHELFLDGLAFRRRRSY